MKPRTRIPRASKRRLAENGGKTLFSTVKKKKRKPSEFRRIYHSKERVEFVKTLTCVGCGYSGPKMENAHIETGGTGRKADYTKIVPLCGNFVDFNYGCHHDLHKYGRATFERSTRTNLEEAAAQTESAWQEHQGFLAFQEAGFTGIALNATKRKKRAHTEASK